jgi:hypothetical protein
MKYAYLPIVSILMIPLAGPAQADARGDVLAGISRCAGIADDRTWLDCIYGAAQPMRAQLGLAPALAAQTQLVPPAIPGAPPVHLVPEGSAPPGAPKKKNTGLSLYMFGDSDYPVVSKIAMASYQFDNNGAFTVTLANGQRWTQIDTSNLAHWRGPASRLVVTIMPGALGTFNLFVAGEADVYKVHRLH